jgi:hypothetical protein
MEQALMERCVQLLDQVETIKDLTRGRSVRRIGHPRHTQQPERENDRAGNHTASKIHWNKSHHG